MAALIGQLATGSVEQFAGRGMAELEIPGSTPETNSLTFGEKEGNVEHEQ